MKKLKKVYGVYNLVEWSAVLRSGKATVRVLFSGGAMTTQGVIPATHATSNPVVQMAIERSDAFRSGKIRLVNTYPLKGEVPVGRNAPKTADTDPGEHAAEESAPAPGKADPMEIGGDTQDGSAPKEGIPATKSIRVVSDRDAAEYLRDNFGIALKKLGSKSAINAAAQQYGVKFEYTAEGQDA